MQKAVISILIALLVIPSIAPVSKDDDNRVSPNSICEFLPWLPGCDFFK